MMPNTNLSSQILENEHMHRRQNILDFESLLTQMPESFLGDNQNIAPLEHIFTDGIYVRKIFLPKDFLCTSKIHKKAHPYIILSGKVAVYTEHEGAQEITGPFLGITPPMTKRTVFAMEDTIWITFHRTDNIDLKAIEKEIIAPDFRSLEAEERKELSE